MPQSPPSELETQVLSVLWRDGPSTARQVREALPDGKKRSYTTVLSVMQVMEKKGLLTHTLAGRAHVYAPTVSRRQTLGPMLRQMVQRLFHDSPVEAVQHLLSETPVSDVEMRAIRKMLDEAQANKKGGRR